MKRDLRKTFRRWASGSYTKIIKIAQGDDNLIVVLVSPSKKLKSFHSYSVATYIYQRSKKFKLLTSYFYRDKYWALKKFKKILEEF